MKIAKFISSLFITLALIYLLNNNWPLGTTRIPPLGKFLDPFHGFWQNMETKNYTGPATLEVKHIKEPVTVIYDSILIPHIFAKNDEDLYLAQGFVTANHRLWQMEFQTHAAAGRIAEIIGRGKDDVILNYDRTQRRLGMVYGAEHAVEEMFSDPISKMMIEKYTDGINQYIASLSYEELPFEYKLLDYQPESWTSIKVGLLLQTMAKSLNIGDKDMEMTNALKLFGRDVMDLLYPDRDLQEDPIVDKTGGWNFKPISPDTTSKSFTDERITTKRMTESDPNIGSNNWAVNGKKTTTGSPILCSDPHLNLSLPSIWFVVQLNAPGVNVMGASLPGAPSVVIGFNDSIAWAVTNAQRDLVDWFSIQYKNKKRNEYLLDNKWRPVKKVIEKITLRGEDAFSDTIIYTNWGPVTYDENFHAEQNLKDYAFRWIAHDPSNELIALYKLNRAKNHQNYLDAISHFESPAQNFAFASVSGDIAMCVQGKFPVRRKEEGKFVLDGSKSANGWQAFIPNEQNVQYKNPERNFVSSANQYPVDNTYPYYITAESYEAYRNRRINKVLRENDHISVKDLMKLQNDNYNLKAEESLPTFLSYLDSTTLTGEELNAYKILKSWNYYNDIESEGASYYEAWWDNLMPMLWDEMSSQNTSMALPTTYNTIKLIKEKPDLSFFDIKSTEKKETASDVLQLSFKEGVKVISQWKKEHSNQTHVAWADYKDSYMEHLLRIEPLNIHVRHGGNHDIVNAHSKKKGPSWRMVVSLEKDGVKTWATYPGGQSGNPGSIHYADLLDRWVKEQYFNLLFLQKPSASNRIFYQTQLTPSSCD
jgi:penicillin amidase